MRSFCSPAQAQMPACRDHGPAFVNQVAKSGARKATGGLAGCDRDRQPSASLTFWHIYLDHLRHENRPIDQHLRSSAGPQAAQAFQPFGRFGAPSRHRFSVASKAHPLGEQCEGLLALALPADHAHRAVTEFADASGELRPMKKEQALFPGCSNSRAPERAGADKEFDEFEPE